MTNDELISEFISFKRMNQGRRERTAQAYGDYLTRLSGFMDGRSILDANEDDLILFSGPWLHKSGVGPRARRPYIAAVREFFKWAAIRRKRHGNPAENLSYPRSGRKLPAAMDRDSTEKLLWAPDLGTFEGVRDAAMLSLMAGCGLRVGGLVALNESQFYQVPIDGEPRMMINATEKGGKDRRLPVPREADLMLRLYLEHPDLKAIDRSLPNGDQVMFVSTRNRMVPPHDYVGEKRRLTSRTVLDRIKHYGKRAGIDERLLHPHALRHLFGTELAESNVDLLVRQDLMGHEDPKHTEIYTHMAIQRKFKEVDRSGPLAKIRTPAGDLLGRLSGRK